MPSQDKNEVAFTIRLNRKLAKDITALSDGLNRSKNYLLNEAVANYVSQKMKSYEGIMTGLEDIRKRKVYSHKEVMGEIDGIIASAKKSKKKK